MCSRAVHIALDRSTLVLYATDPLARVEFGLLDPFVQGLHHTANLLRDRYDCRPTTLMLPILAPYLVVLRIARLFCERLKPRFIEMLEDDAFIIDLGQQQIFARKMSCDFKIRVTLGNAD